MKHITKHLEKHKPAASKTVLLFLAGGLWMSVGIMLLSFAASWLLKSTNSHRYICAVAGVILALLVHHFGFLKIVNRNLKRILPLDEKRCVFAFMPWKSYLIIPLMITLGIVLRHSRMPKEYLAILYIGIGMGLLLSSIRYLRIFLKEIRD